MSFPGQSPTGASDAEERTLRTMSLAFLTMSVVFGVLIVVTVGTATPNLVYVAVAVLVVVAGFLLAQRFGYRRSQTIAAAATRQSGLPSQFATAFHRRVALTEGPIFVNLVICALCHSAWPYLIAWPFAAASMAFHLIPSAALRRRWDAHRGL